MMDTDSSSRPNAAVVYIESVHETLKPENCTSKVRHLGAVNFTFISNLDTDCPSFSSSVLPNLRTMCSLKTIFKYWAT